jgi:hypothetical protein
MDCSYDDENNVMKVVINTRFSKEKVTKLAMFSMVITNKSVVKNE